MTVDRKGSPRLRRAFWIVACGDIVLILAAALKIALGPASRYDALVYVLMLVLIVAIGVGMGVVALIGHRVAYGVGLALAAWLPLYYGGSVVMRVAATPSEQAIVAGHGYFTAAADRALADAIVAGDGAKVAALAPSANLKAVGWNNMSFMRLALEDGHANPVVVAALLRAGLDPDQDDQLLFGFMTGSEADYGAMIKDKNEPLLRAVIGSGVDLNHGDLAGYPRFFSALAWPEGLGLLLEQGANAEAEDSGGYTAIMWAVMLQYWPAIDVLLAHGARTDHVARNGKSLRDIVIEQRERQHGDIPPQLARLEARLR